MRLPRRPVPSGEQLGQAGDEGGGVLLRIKDPPRAKQETTQSSEGFLLVSCWFLVAGYWLILPPDRRVAGSEQSISNQQ